MCIRFETEQERLIWWSKRMQAWTTGFEPFPDGDRFPGSSSHILTIGTERERKMQSAYWGLTPFWAKDESFGRKNAYNARSETILEKPTFRGAFRKRRCIVPMTAFFERSEGRWLRFGAANGILAVAGLYEEPNQVCPTASFALVTTDPNETVGATHDRMPVLLGEPEIERWLDPEAETEELRSLMIPCPPDWTSVADAGPIGRKQEKPPTTEPTLF